MSNVQDLLTRPQCDECHHVMCLRRIERWRDDGHPHAKYIWQCPHCATLKYERI